MNLSILPVKQTNCFQWTLTETTGLMRIRTNMRVYLLNLFNYK